MSINSTQPFLLVRFTTDMANRERGFALDWSLGAALPPPVFNTSIPPGGGGALLGGGAPPELPKDHCEEPVQVFGDSGEITDGEALQVHPRLTQA